jgi:hypothetical protein
MSDQPRDWLLQLRITLEGVRPPVWRRLLLPSDCTFWELHVAIQDSMGWLDRHLHEFLLPAAGGEVVRIGIPDDESPGEVLPGWLVAVGERLIESGQHLSYLYDFGDDWSHDVVLEDIVPRPEGESFPRCVDGQRACPPEDCGGPPGYAELLAVLADPDHEERETYLDWLGGDFDSEAFDPSEVEFDDPAERFQRAFGEPS